MHYSLSVYGTSDVGLVRQNNEDFWDKISDGRFCALADGMGGHQAGEIASKETVNLLCELLKQNLTAIPQSIEETKKKFSLFIQEVNACVFRMGHESEELRGMGTTLCFVYFHPDGLIYGHVGDSRIYRFRRSQLEQLTHDHSLLREMMDLGQIDAQQAGKFAYKNIITKAIGTEPFVEPSISNTIVEPGDVLLLCSDGLTDLLNHEEIEQILSCTPEDEMPSQLVKMAKIRGGYDNITVVLVKVQSV